MCIAWLCSCLNSVSFLCQPSTCVVSRRNIAKLTYALSRIEKSSSLSPRLPGRENWSALSMCIITLPEFFSIGQLVFGPLFIFFGRKAPLWWAGVSQLVDVHFFFIASINTWGWVVPQLIWFENVTLTLPFLSNWQDVCPFLIFLQLFPWAKSTSRNHISEVPDVSL